MSFGDICAYRNFRFEQSDTPNVEGIRYAPRPSGKIRTKIVRVIERRLGGIIHRRVTRCKFLSPTSEGVYATLYSVVLNRIWPCWAGPEFELAAAKRTESRLNLGLTGLDALERPGSYIV